MLIDRCVIEVRSGKGGDGAISFLHDKNTEFGGPDGGNGGRGGSVYLIARANLNTLYNFRHSRVIQAADGEKGLKKNMYGHAAEDVTVEVPVGTVVSEEKTGQILADLKQEGDKVLVAQGGRGGKGNACFKSARHRIPRIAENGHPGERKRLILELKMLADAGLIGFPSVGKSTFLNVCTKANVPTADYPFTTLVPNLGVVYLKDGRSFVLADMPGLIEGAHQGKGLGIQFLRHIERCRVLIHMVAMDGQRDPFSDYRIINAELKEYGADLEKRPQIVVASLMDAEGAEARKAAFDKQLGFKSLPLSSLTHLGVDPLLKKAADLIAVTPEFPLKGEGKEGGIKVYDAHLDPNAKTFEIVQVHPHLWQIQGEKVEREYALINITTDEGIQKLIRYLDKIGVEARLKELGAQDGDTVRLGEFEFEYSD
jgi:GTP-binding protein